MPFPLTKSSLLLALSCGFCVSTPAREVVHLVTGFELQAKSHVVAGSVYVLTTEFGTLEFPVEQVSSIEILPDVPDPKPAPSLNLDTLIETGASSQAAAPEFIRFVRSVARIESGMHPEAVSPKGALGLMQLMPATAKALGVSPTDIEANIQGGAKYLRELLLRYENDAVLALAAYNAGPAAVARFGGVPPYDETRRYIVKVLQEYAREQASEKSVSSNLLSNTRTRGPRSSPLPKERASSFAVSQFAAGPSALLSQTAAASR